MEANNSSESKRLRVLVSGGGTGGHIFPALSIANEVKRRRPEAEILFVGALGRFTTVDDPKAESYYHLSPYLYCAANPIRNIDPSGMELFFTGNRNQVISMIDQISSFCPGILPTYSEADSQVSYCITDNNRINDNSKYLMTIIDDSDIKVNIKAIDSHEYTRKFIIGGAFWGTSIKGHVVETKNIVNTTDLELIDTFHKKGTSIMHEITESYIAGKVSKALNCNAPPALSTNRQNTIYKIAHISAIPQVPLFSDKVRNDDGSIIEHFFIEDNDGKQYIIYPR